MRGVVRLIGIRRSKTQFGAVHCVVTLCDFHFRKKEKKSVQEVDIIGLGKKEGQPWEDSSCSPRREDTLCGAWSEKRPAAHAQCRYMVC